MTPEDHVRPRRSWRERLEAAPQAVRQAEEFRARIADAEGDVLRLADLMAEAIELARKVRSLDIVGRDGRQFVSIDTIQADYCVDDAREAYVAARKSNHA